jgi:sulfide:quinone oxidoreductase
MGFRYAMVVPPFLGADVVRRSGPANPRGFVDVKDTYQAIEYPNVYAVGIAAAVNALTTQESFGEIPAICIMDAGNNGVAILADRMLPPRKHGVLIPGPQNHAAKIAFEKYFMWKMRSGYVKLP